MTRNSTMILLLTASVLLMSGCKIPVNDAVYCHQSDLDLNTPDERFCVQLDSNEIGIVSKLVSRAKIHKRAKYVSFSDDHSLPGTISIATNSTRHLSCKAGTNKIICDKNIVIEINRMDDESYEEIYRSLNFYSKLRTSRDSATSCHELIYTRLKKHDSAIVMMSKDLAYYTAATCMSAGETSIPDEDIGNDTIPLRINRLMSPQLICIPGTTPPNLDSLSLGFSKSIIEFAGRFREFRVDRRQIASLCRNANFDSINDWAKSASEHHETLWAEVVNFSDRMQSINPDCDTVIRRHGIASEIKLADKFIKRQEQKQ